MELIRTNRVENGTELLKRCCGHPVFRGSSALERGDLQIKGKDKTTIHFNGSDKTVKVILRTIISVNELSVYGAVADMCDELARDISKISEDTGGTCRSERFGNHGDPIRIVDNQFSFFDQ